MDITDSNNDANNYDNGNCDYLSISQYSNLVKAHKHNELPLIHFNVRSLPKNKSKIIIF